MIRVESQEFINSIGIKIPRALLHLGPELHCSPNRKTWVIELGNRSVAGKRGEEPGVDTSR